ncbi:MULTISPECIES: N-acetylmuramoyl-L-alanine amidase [Acinetobacter]|jgi:N-acetylmuramoyl-L-alanine amidase|uniref:N-acetylmuramoyl-L-alanine amidase n=1 Tax=Acinetobacter TaxID=469 RepID=UPI000447AB55|nr:MULTISPECIES: N-acetylmuramoyl-L-alanine amidase [Acinetobacter]EXF55790.1 putative N-acetylmuramoyl-L-alanine amidase domain protein [Acinetobacter sp. 1294596]MCK4091890.1 N-acetylmuramoyl-L-alanine amidase [Acinetobacter radioresistens]MCK4115390.1 N-acetylmuramoyl-L-alanine amidase [Acinetobacter radioresistens]MCU4623098.1 N-acetylmuramoyl-L-alanine amidase [Acinetobacter radioresistens]
MKFIPENVTKYLSVKLPLLGAFLSLLVLILQWALDYQIIPVEYQLLIINFVIPALAWIGRKIAQPNLNQNQPLGFVTVTAGHSNVDPGAVSGKFKEAELVTNFRNAVAYYLKSSGISIKTDGVGTTNNPLASAIKLIKGSSVAVEFHLNAAGSSQANGVETIALPKDKKLAQDLSKAVASALGSRLRGNEGWIDQSQSARGKLGFINNGGLIVELGFISNEDEISRFNARYWLAAKAVADVLIEYEASQ